MRLTEILKSIPYEAYLLINDTYDKIVFWAFDFCIIHKLTLREQADLNAQKVAKPKAGTYHVLYRDLTFKDVVELGRNKDFQTFEQAVNDVYRKRKGAGVYEFTKPEEKDDYTMFEVGDDVDIAYVCSEPLRHVLNALFSLGIKSVKAQWVRTYKGDDKILLQGSGRTKAIFYAETQPKAGIDYLQKMSSRKYVFADEYDHCTRIK